MPALWKLRLARLIGWASQASTIQLTPSGEVDSVGVLGYISVDISKALESSGVKVNAISSTPEKN